MKNQNDRLKKGAKALLACGAGIIVTGILWFSVVTPLLVTFCWPD